MSGVNLPVDEVLKQAMAYERAYNLIHTLTIEARGIRKSAAKRGEQDHAHGIAIKALEDALNRLESVTNDVWKKVEELAVPDDKHIIDLFNAVVINAALDYESALSRGGAAGEKEQREIERFAESETSYRYSGTDFSSVLARIRRCHKQFEQMVQDKGEDIIEDTAKHRKINSQKKGNTRFDKATYRCPLCGGGIYHFGTPINNVYNIRCSSCNLEGWYKRG